MLRIDKSTKIAVCDDSVKDINAIREVLTKIQFKWNVDFETNYFYSGEELFQNIKSNEYDIILLDIFMSGIDGLETARLVRSLGEESKIIFISSDDERFREFFDVGAIGFLDKPINSDLFEKTLKRAFDLLDNDSENVFTYKSKFDTCYIKFKDIIYFESNKNSIIIHTVNGTESYYETISKLWSRIKELDDFVMSHRGYIFNLNFVVVRADKIVIRKTDEEYTIGKSYKNETQDRYMKYIKRRCD